MKIRIEIGELVLYGFNYHDHRRIGAAIKQELAELIQENGLRYGGRILQYELSKMDAGRINLSSDMSPKLIGNKVAQSIFESLGLHNE